MEHRNRRDGAEEIKENKKLKERRRLVLRMKQRNEREEQKMGIESVT